MPVAAPVASHFEPLVEATPAVGITRGGLTDALLERYGGDLVVPLREDRPTVIANFVSSLDGVV